MRPTRVYLCGPIYGPNLPANVRTACEVAAQLLKAGYAVFCPHLSVYLGGDVPQAEPCGIGWEELVAANLPWIEVSDVVVRLPGESRGADIETGFAVMHGVRIVEWAGLGVFQRAVAVRR